MKIEIKEERILEKIELFIQENNLPFEIEIPKKESDNEYDEEMKMKDLDGDPKPKNRRLLVRILEIDKLCRCPKSFRCVGSGRGCSS